MPWSSPKQPSETQPDGPSPDSVGLNPLGNRESRTISG